MLTLNMLTAASHTLVADVTPDYRVATGLRRATDQQIKPLRDLNVTLLDQF